MLLLMIHIRPEKTTVSYSSGHLSTRQVIPLQILLSLGFVPYRYRCVLGTTGINKHSRFHNKTLE